MTEGSRPELLSPLEAAHYLGITPELLFGYTCTRFRKSANDSRRLISTEVNGATRFARSDLDAFEAYLREPWAEAGADRVDPPKCVRDHLHAESVNQCMRCGSGIGVQTAHIEAWAASRSNYHHNLLRICSSCHIEHDQHNSLPTEQLLALKQAGIARTRMLLAQRMSLQHDELAPPPRDPVFFGRDAALRDLREALRTSRTVLIRGPGGIGKTQLLLRALAGLESGRRLVWIDVERYASAEAVRSALAVQVHSQLGASGVSRLVTGLDALHACVVFDGLEQFRGPSLDDIDDLIHELHGQTANAQYVVTTQVDLPRTVFDEDHQLASLGLLASQHLLRAMLRDSVRMDPASEASLFDLADGHPLALRLTAALANHYGTGRSAVEQIERRGVAALELQRRTKQDRQTSLSVCLSLAYDALGPDEALALYLVANSPAGILSAVLESARHLIADGRSTIAGLQRWNLVQTVDAGERFERLFMLSPIAAYADERWRADHPDRAQKVENKLLREFALMAIAISERAQDASEIPHMVGRYMQELPNILRIFDAAEDQPGNEDLALFARSLCTALMRFFFIMRVPELGTEVMLRGTRIALRDGKFWAASNLLVQTVALAIRTDEEGPIALVQTMLREIAVADSDLETRGNIELVRASIAHHAHEVPKTEQHARLAIAHFEAALSSSARDPSLENVDDEGAAGIRNDLSASFSILGDALLAQEKFEAARDAYQTSLSQVRGAAVAVNDGQILHQIGNCESSLSRYQAAAQSYKDAANRFHAIGMRDYLSNALGELGYTILAAPLELSDTGIPPFEVLLEGLDDIAEELVRCLSATSFSKPACAAAIRKLFGIVVLVSLSNKAGTLGPFAYALKAHVIEPAATICDSSDSGAESRSIQFALVNLDRLAALAASIAEFESDVNEGKPTLSEVEQLAKVCFFQLPWADLQRRSFEWLEVYLRVRWRIDVTAGALQAASDAAYGGQPFRLTVSGL